MDPQHITALIIEYRYVILVPLSVIEGPIVALVAGTLAAAGLFDVWAIALFFFARDMIMDSLYYLLGYTGYRSNMLKRMLAKVHIKTEQLNDIRTLWEAHPCRTMFIGKLSYGIASSFIVVAGMVHMDLKKFFGYGALVAITQYWTLIALGYFFGQAMGSQLTDMVSRLEYGLAIASGLAVLYYGGSWFVRTFWFDRNRSI